MSEHQTAPTAPTAPAALAHELGVDPSRPLVTFYDDATGERIELSVKTFDNWVNKIANLFADELMLDAGDVVRVDLPTHWQSTVAIVAAWTAGLAVTFDDSATPAASFVGPDAVADGKSLPGRPIACSLRPLGARFTEPLPDGWLDFAVEVPPQPDQLMQPGQVHESAVAVYSSESATTHAALVALARRSASDAGLEAQGRLLTNLNPASADGLAAALVGPLVTGSSVVLVTNADADRRDATAEQEHVSSQLWRGQ